MRPTTSKTTYTYYPDGAQPATAAWTDRVWKVTDQRGNVTTYEYERLAGGAPCAGLGLVTKITYDDGKYKTFGYDKFGNKVWEENEVRDANGVGQRTTYTYDDYNRLTSVKLPATDQFPNPLPTKHDYTATSGAGPYSHTTKSIRKTTSPTGIITGQTFDENFRLSATIQAQGTSLAATTSYGYDPNGNQTSIDAPLTLPTTIAYDNRNR